MLERLWSRNEVALGAFLPKVIEHDQAEGVLILEATPGGRDLARQHSGGRFSRVLARQAGGALARLHGTPLDVLHGLPIAVDPTLALRPHEPDWEFTCEMSAAALQLTRVIQSSDELCTGLDELIESWSEESVIHGDVRWDNSVAARDARTQRWSRVQLIDWEHCASGEPSFDLGAFLGEYLCAWLQSIPIVDPADLSRLIGHARFPLQRMRPALGEFWNAYIRHRRPGELDSTLNRATLFAASRVLMIALEQAQALAELRPGVLGLVSLSENIFRRPQEASARLLGIEPSRVPA